MQYIKKDNKLRKKSKQSANQSLSFPFINLDMLSIGVDRNLPKMTCWQMQRQNLQNRLFQGAINYDLKKIKISNSQSCIKLKNRKITVKLSSLILSGYLQMLTNHQEQIINQHDNITHQFSMNQLSQYMKSQNMYTIQFKREVDYRQNQYCILQFKGKFESDSCYGDAEHKTLVHLGQLKKTADGRYKLQIGVMDLVGKQVKLNTKQVVTETILNGDTCTKTILVKGIITKKIVFQNRPAPDMDRVVTAKRDSVNHKMFSKVEERQQLMNEQKQTHK